MTYEDVICPICKNNIGKSHRQDVSETIARHIEKNHIEAYNEIAEMVEQREKIKKNIYDKYGIRINFMNDFYYRKRDITEKEIK